MMIDLSGLEFLFHLAIVGVISLIIGTGWGIYYLFQHIQFI
jgi:hypothetical protein